MATLVTWLLTAGLGAYMLSRLISSGGLRQQRATRGGLSPAVLFGHFSLAGTGLAIWACYLATSWVVLAWSAVGLLMPAIGLGISTVTLWTPYPRPARAAGAGPYPDPGRGGPAGGGPGGPADGWPGRPVTDEVLARALTDDVLASQLVEQVTGRVRWRESIEWLAGEGGVTRFAELGAGKVLTGMVKRIAPDAEGAALNAPADLEAFAKNL